MKLKRLSILLLVLLMVFAGSIIGCSPAEEEPEEDEAENGEEAVDEGPFGGTFRVALDGEPNTLDMQSTTATITFETAMLMFEGLFTLDAGLDVIPMLADSYDVSEDGTIYTIYLREGIKFHNGKEMTAEDVIASLERWGEVSGAGQGIFENVNELYSDGDYTIVFELENPSGVFLVTLAMHNQGAVIYPKEVVEEAGPEVITDYIGTGPYKFVEWRPNQHIKLERYDDYSPVDFPATGYGGEKVAYPDEFVFEIITDGVVALAGLETGEYDYVRGASGDEYERIKDHPNINATASQFRAWLAFVFNKSEGVTSDPLIRQAILLTLDNAPLLEGYRGDDTFWRLDHSIMWKEQDWWSEVGSEKYDVQDLEAAKALLEEANYDGEEIVWITGFQSYYNGSLVAVSQLREIGLNIDLQLLERAAYSDMLTNPELWDVFTTGFTIRPDPTQMAFLSPSFAGWWENDEVQDLLAQMRIEHDFDKRYEMWEEVQRIFFEDVPVIKAGDYSNMRAFSARVQGYEPMADMSYLNLWLAE